VKFVRVAIERPVATAMVFVAVILVGFVSLRELSVDLLPDIRYPRLLVMTRFPGVAPEEMETLVTMPLEAAVSRVPGLRRVESVSKEGVSIMTLEFDWGVNMDFTVLHTREKLDAARDFLPEDAESPTIITLDPQARPVMVLALTAERSLRELKEFAEELVKPRLEQVEGIGSADVTGGVEREIQVEVDPALLALYGMTIEEVGARIDAFNRNLQGGTIRKGLFKYAMRVVGQFQSVAEIGEINLKVTGERGVIKLKDIARVSDGVKERQGMTRLNGNESVGILVHKQAGANTVKVTEAAHKVIEELKKENPGVALDVVSEEAAYIKQAINAVRDEIIQGALLAFLVLLIFLQEWKTPLIIGTVIPVSIIGTFSLLFYGRITLNVMSLGGLALGVGMLDDCAVVVSENIFRHRQLGKPPAEAAYIGTREVGPAVIAACLNTIAVFFPVVYVRGVAGELFKDTALAVTFALLASLVVALTLIPMLTARGYGFQAAGPAAEVESADDLKGAARAGSKLRPLLAPFRLLKRLLYLAAAGVGKAASLLWKLLSRLFRILYRAAAFPFRPLVRAVFTGFNRSYEKFIKGYHRWLIWSLEHKARVTLLALLFFALTTAAGLAIRRELMPEMKAKAFEIQLKTPSDYSLEQTSDLVAALERFLRARPDVAKTLSQTGIVSGQEGLNPDVSLNFARLYVEVAKPRELAAVMEALRGRLADYPDISYNLTREESTIAGTLGLAAAEIKLRVKGEDLNRLRAVSEEVVKKLSAVPGIADVNTNLGEGKPEFQVRLRRDALQKYVNLSPAAVGDFLVNAVRGRVATQYHELDKKSDVLVRLQGGGRMNIEGLLDQLFPHQGTLIPLRELVTYDVVRGPGEIRRENQRREVLVTARLSGLKLSQAVPAVQRALASVEMPSDYAVVFGGEREEMARSFRSLVFALVLAVLLTYMIMAAQFESLLHPFLIMFTLPMGTAGCVVAMLLTGQTVNIISVIGMIVLVGLVVDNATIKVDYINQLRRGGLGLREAVVEGSHVRLRPILMSTFTTLIGLVPMALGLETGGELLRPLGIVVIGGLTFSTFLTLILIPVIYEWVEERRKPRTPAGAESRA